VASIKILTRLKRLHAKPESGSGVDREQNCPVSKALAGTEIRLKATLTKGDR
jgi:hypothetical protein